MYQRPQDRSDNDSRQQKCLGRESAAALRQTRGDLRRLTAAELGGLREDSVRVARIYVPEKTKRSQIFDDPPKEAAAKLVEKLRFEARVI